VSGSGVQLPEIVTIEPEGFELGDWKWMEADLLRVFIQGDFFTLIGTVYPPDASQELYWASSHPEWLSVDENGYIQTGDNLVDYGYSFLNQFNVAITASTANGVSAVMRIHFDTTEEQPRF